MNSTTTTRGLDSAQKVTTETRKTVDQPRRLFPARHPVVRRRLAVLGELVMSEVISATAVRMLEGFIRWPNLRQSDAAWRGLAIDFEDIVEHASRLASTRAAAEGAVQ
jgi:hypothetical protein